MKLKQLGLRASAIGLGILIAVLLTEGLLRLIGFEFNLYPTKVQFGFPDPITIQRSYELDPDLLWVPRDYATRVAVPAGRRPDLVFMGCSCTEFGRYDRYFGEIVDEQHPQNSFSFVNLGVGGWSSYQGLKQLERDVVPMNPRLITIYFGWNDHWCTFGIEDKQIATYNLEHPLLLTGLVHKSRVAQLINRTVFSYSFQGQSDSRRVSVEDFRSNLKQMVRITRQNSIIPVLLTAPSAHRVGEEPAYLQDRWLKELSELVPLHESYVQAVRQVAREDDVYLVDLYSRFRELPWDDQVESFSEDGIHLTEYGDRRIARYLYEYFVETELIDELISR